MLGAVLGSGAQGRGLSREPALQGGRREGTHDRISLLTLEMQAAEAGSGAGRASIPGPGKSGVGIRAPG